MEYSYTTINQADVRQAIIDGCAETSAATLRVSTDPTPRAVLKYLGAKPASLGAVTVYSKAEIHIELARPEWNLEA